MHIHLPSLRAARPARGVTLIELMMVVAILSIIAAVAYPAYIQHVRKGNRAAAQAYMMDLASREGEILVDSHSYAPQAEVVALVPTPAAVSKYYTITIAPPTTAPPKFTITATPIAGGRQVPDGTLTLDYAGVKTPATKW